MTLREEIMEIVSDHIEEFEGDATWSIQTITNEVVSKFEKLIDEEIEGLLHKKKDKDLFLDGNCIDSTLQMLEKLKVLLK